MQICYVVTSQDSDSFADMAFVSASAVRRLHPEARIVLLTDEETDRSLRRRKSPLIDFADQYTAVPTEYRGAVASRFVKTRQRQLVEGPYVFMDVDAIPVRPIADLFDRSSSFAAAIDRHPYVLNDEVTDFLMENFRAMDWQMPYPPINSGVVYWADDEAARAIGEEWHRRWHSMYKTTGIHRDQTSLLSALYTVGAPIDLLPPKYNQMVGFGLDFSLMGLGESIAARRQMINDACVWHFAGDDKLHGMVLHQMVDHLRRTGRIEWDLLDQAVEKCDPWGGYNPASSTEFPSATIERHLLLGDRARAMYLWARFKCLQAVKRLLPTSRSHSNAL